MRIAVVILFLVAAAAAVAGQSTSPADLSPDADHGFTALVQVGGNVNSSGHVIKLDSSAGYNFTPHFGVDLGAPIYFAGTAATATTSGSSNNGIGNPYIDVRVTFLNPAVNYRSVVAAYLPLADRNSGFSTGRVTFDWTNHFDRSFARFTPFVNVGVANSVPDSRLFDRPFTTLGFNTHLEGGTTFALTRQLSVGASVYGILPTGDQTIYSKMVKNQAGGSMTNSTNSHRPVFETQSQVTGTSDLAQDHGFSAWVGVNPNRYLNLEVGYTRSKNYALDSLAFSVGLNVGRMWKDKSRP